MKSYGPENLIAHPAHPAHPASPANLADLAGIVDPAGSHKPPKLMRDVARQALWTTTEAAIILRCDVRTLRNHLRRGNIAGVRIAREWRIPASQFGAVASSLLSLQGFPEHTDIRGLMCGAPGGEPMGVGYTKDCFVRHAAPDVHCSAAVPGASAVPARLEPALRIYLLGSPQVYINEMRLPRLERSNRRREVIHLLALHRSGMSVSQLASSLNMASHRYEDESLTPHYVRTLVWGIRDQARESAGWDGIIQSPIKQGAGLHHYQLPDNTWCDLWEFEDRLDLADHLVARGARLAGSSAPLGSLGSAWPQVLPNPSPERAGQVAAFAHDAAALREEALQLYRGAFCHGSGNGCLIQAARELEERYKCAALQQGEYWRATAIALQAGAPARRSPLWGEQWTGRVGRASTASDRTLPFGAARPEVRSLWREALRNFERVLHVDNYHEEAYMSAMECYAYLGSARGVSLIFSRYRDVARAELSQMPSAGVLVLRAHERCKKLLRVGHLPPES